MSLRKLFQNGDDRAVSPIIGVILMVAITVILAAVIGMFVLDMGGSVEQEAQGSVSWNVDNATGDVEVTATNMKNADSIEIRGGGSTVTLSEVGQTETFTVSGSGTLNAVGLTESGTETVISQQSYDVED